MAKLSKQEVTAIANVLYKELVTITEKAREQAIANYIPSEQYLELEKLLEDRDYFEEESDRFHGLHNKAKDTIYTIVNKLKLDTPYYGSKEKILNELINKEHSFSEVLSIEDLKNEVIIAAIDDSFDVSRFIGEQVAKFTKKD